MVPFHTVTRLSERLGIPAAEMLAVIGIAARTAARRQQQGVLKPDEADRLLRVARIVEDADRVFGSPEESNRWIRSPHPILEGLTPFALLDSDAGAQVVSDELMRAWRLTRSEYASEPLSGMAAARVGGRWNSRGVRMGYCCSSRPLALLEMLVHDVPDAIVSPLAVLPE